MLGGDLDGLAFKDWAFATWQQRYGVKPPWQIKDFVVLAKALKAIGSEDLARSTWKLYLASTDPFYAGHDPGHFLSSLSRWVSLAHPKTKAARHNSFPGAERAAAMAKIAGEVAKDPAIPREKKQDEMRRRWKEIR